MENLKSIWDVLDEIEVDEDRALDNFYDITCDFSELLVEYRIKNNMTQSQLAEKLDVSQAMVSKYENGDYNFSLKKLCEICDLLEYDISVEFQPIISQTEWTGNWLLQEQIGEENIGSGDKQLCRIA